MAEPFWGPQTSYLNFCEEDYVVTRYIAEFINTLSSLTFVAFGLYGLFIYPGSPTGPRLVSYCGLIGVGLCSAGYHMTLKYHTQMSDELSMHLLTTPLIYRLLTYKATPQRTKWIGIGLSTLFTIVMVTHMVMDEFLLHASTFGLGVYVIVTGVIKVIPHQVPDPKLRSTLRNTTNMGLAFFILGYIVWLIDDWACRHLTDMRKVVGIPLAFLLELHGWWHVLTAIGGYIAVAVIDLMMSGVLTEDITSHLAWPVPQAVRLVGALRGSSEERKKD
ncbi:ceramidase [Stachybotrys elegans]|uniref:Ceramidase n=1 Tax=Stachybotrys elegans TaxID=80388 RepID=A0A8K0WMM2_9HYPO|nr:ceramidase [Stachybotrys elegans]